MKGKALGVIETVGYATALSAADSALKAANVSLSRMERVIGVGKMLGVTVYITGDVAAVQVAVDAGANEGSRVGKVISVKVIPNLSAKVRENMLGETLQYFTALK